MSSLTLTQSCVDPRSVQPGNEEQIGALFLSHDWKITSSENRATGILVRYRCDKCGATGLALFNIRLERD